MRQLKVVLIDKDDFGFNSQYGCELLRKDISAIVDESDLTLVKTKTKNTYHVFMYRSTDVFPRTLRFNGRRTKPIKRSK